MTKQQQSFGNYAKKAEMEEQDEEYFSPEFKRNQSHDLRIEQKEVGGFNKSEKARIELKKRRSTEKKYMSPNTTHITRLEQESLGQPLFKDIPRNVSFGIKKPEPNLESPNVVSSDASLKEIVTKENLKTKLEAAKR